MFKGAAQIRLELLKRCSVRACIPAAIWCLESDERGRGLIPEEREELAEDQLRAAPAPMERDDHSIRFTRRWPREPNLKLTPADAPEAEAGSSPKERTVEEQLDLFELFPRALLSASGE